ncbi:MAG: hypothetical protein KAI64_01505, partial [Thermoplasmata archaeon]|nr:hypothetical protein [Thermoplasmata archaeon]
LSRCQRFDLKQIPTVDIVARLEKIAETEKIKAEEDALMLIARAADGSMRDAESIFDQMISYGDGEVTAEIVSVVLGLVGEDVLGSIDRAIIEKNFKLGLEIVAKVIDEGKNAERFLDDLTKHYRDVLIVKTVEDAADFLAMSPERIEVLKKTAENFDEERIIYIIDLLTTASEKLRHSISQRMALEMAIINLLRVGDRVSIDEILTKIEKMRLESGGGSKGTSGGGPGSSGRMKLGETAGGNASSSPLIEKAKDMFGGTIISDGR